MNARLFKVLLCALLLGLTSVPAWAICRSETRVGGSAVFSSDFASQENAKPIAASGENAACGYDFASGVHKYLYAQDDPVDGTDPSGLKLIKCTMDATTPELRQLGAQHQYLYNDKTAEIYEMTGTQEHAYGRVMVGTDPPPDSPDCIMHADVPNSDGKEAAVADSIRKYPPGPWVFRKNDCETLIHTALTENGLTDPKLLGRWSWKEFGGRNWKTILVDALYGATKFEMFMDGGGISL